MKSTSFIAGIAFALAALAAGHAAAADDKPYGVVGGNKVDKITLEGWRTWRALACERCHGARQEGLVGPSLVESMSPNPAGKKLVTAQSKTSCVSAGSVRNAVCVLSQCDPTIFVICMTFSLSGARPLRRDPKL